MNKIVRLNTKEKKLVSGGWQESLPSMHDPNINITINCYVTVKHPNGTVSYMGGKPTIWQQDASATALLTCVEYLFYGTIAFSAAAATYILTSSYTRFLLKKNQ